MTTQRETTFLENSAIKITTALGAIGALAAGVWWAATVSSDLRFLVTTNVQIVVTQKEMNILLSNHEQRLTALEISGSPRLRDLATQVTVLERQVFELKAKQGP